MKRKIAELYFIGEEENALRVNIENEADFLRAISKSVGEGTGFCTMITPWNHRVVVNLNNLNYITFNIIVVDEE